MPSDLPEVPRLPPHMLRSLQRPAPPPASGETKTVTRKKGTREISERPVTYVCTWCRHAVCEYRYPSKTPTIGPACQAEYRAYWERCRYARKKGKPEPERNPTTDCSTDRSNLFRHTEHGWALQPGAIRREQPPQAALIVAGTPAERAAIIELLKTRLGSLLTPSDNAPEGGPRKGPFDVFTVTLRDE